MMRQLAAFLAEIKDEKEEAEYLLQLADEYEEHVAARDGAKQPAKLKQKGLPFI